MKNDLGLLIARIGAGGMMCCLHGYGKLTSFGSTMGQFPDPIGIGSLPSHVLIVFAEFFCAIAVVLGLFTRFASAVLAFAMLVAGFIAHAADPWSKKELALLYAAAFIALFFLGAGRYSLDHIIRRKPATT